MNQWSEKTDIAMQKASRFDRPMDLLLRRNRWVEQMEDWAERVEAAMEEQDRQIADLSERVSRLESRQK